MYLYNGKIYTLDGRNSVISEITIREDRIVELGSDHNNHPAFESQVEGIDLKGKVVLPGLTDAHIHLEQYALALQKVDCEVDTKDECIRRVAERSRQIPPGCWILGHGWNQNSWQGGFGNAGDLDAVALEQPVYLTAKSLHAGWANSAALKLAGIGPETLDPPDGQIGKDLHGNPDGILYESAMQLVEDVIPEPTLEEVKTAIEKAQHKLWEMGLTSVHDFDRRRCFVALQKLHAEGNLKLRVLKSIPLELLDEAIALGLRSGFGDDFLRIGGVKVFADGALGPHTAAMLQPYEGQAKNRGMLFLDNEEFFEIGCKAVGNNLSLAVHAIGDRANHEILEAYERLRNFERQQPELMGMPKLRHRIEHVQVLHSDDVGRLAEMGVAASMQPIHATSDMEMADRYWGERAALSYAYQSQIQAGAAVAFGSDAPVESPNPFWGLHAAVARRRRDGSPGPDGWYPEQRASVQQAIEAYTKGPAFVAGWEDRVGQLAPGYYADLIVLEQDPFELPPQELHSLKPLATMVAGEWVRGALD
jgi:predicted amidohydrolase YtcJ